MGGEQMQIRRVVTAKNDAGKSVVISDGTSPREVVFQHTKGFVSSPLWMLNETPDLTRGHAETMVGAGSLLAPVGGAVFLVVTFPPDSVMFAQDWDPAKAGMEHVQSVPGIVDTFEMDNPGMHTTPTVDFVTVIEGEIVLELDDGKTVTLKQGDTAVQHGVRHAWRNPGTAPASVSFVMIGAKTA
jgi:mannose-6-phosphate isomerase-like protein (cupin superfamily)